MHRVDAGRHGASRPERLRPRTAALAGIVLAGVAWWVLVFAGYGVERSACPDPSPALATIAGVATPLAATLGWALAIWAYRATAAERSAQWLVGAAGLYVGTLAWGATVTGAVGLLVVDVCRI